MFSRLAVQLAKPAAGGAAGLSTRVGAQSRFVSKQAFAGGSKGRKMPVGAPRATEPVLGGLDATLTIRVRHALSL
jgi:hypothetical protein